MLTMTDGDFTRQSFLGRAAEQIFADACVVICGLGGGGSHVAQQLAHLGVGRYRLIDPDVIEASNLNRLVGGTQLDVDARTPKVEIAKRMIKSIRPWADVEISQQRWQQADQLMRDAHIVFGCLDGYQQRDYLEGAARRYLQPYIDIGMDVTELSDGSFAIAGQMITTVPGGPCMRCLGFLTAVRLSAEENDYGDAGINPQVVWTNGTLASLAVGSFVSLLTPWFPMYDTYRWLELDGNRQTVTPSRQPQYMPQHAACPHHGGPDGLGDPFFSLRK